MAMNKAEQAEMQRLRERAALRFTDPPKPIDTDVALAVAKVRDNNDWVSGWTFRLDSSGFGSPGRVLPGIFSDNRNYTSNDGKIRTPAEVRSSGNGMSQGRGGPWYVSKTNAWRAMRHALELKTAERLAWIDSEIMEAFTEESWPD